MKPGPLPAAPALPPRPRSVISQDLVFLCLITALALTGLAASTAAGWMAWTFIFR